MPDYIFWCKLCTFILSSVTIVLCPFGAKPSVLEVCLGWHLEKSGLQKRKIVLFWRILVRYSEAEWEHKDGICQVMIHRPLSSVQFSRSVVSDSLRHHESQHIRPPYHHQLLEFTQTNVHQVGDAIQPSHPLSSPSPPAPNPSQHQGLVQWVNSLHEVAKVLEFQL